MNRRNIYSFLILLFAVIFSPATISAQVNRVATYNIKFNNPKDEINKWDNRKEALVDLLRYYAPDICGMQEALVDQLLYIDERLPNYARIGVGRDDGKVKGEFSPIYYNTNIFTLLEKGTFWLSSTPNLISVGWDASMERICTYGIFQNKLSEKKLLVMNAHFDHVGSLARQNAAELMIEKMKEINMDDLPVIIMGDFNAVLGSAPIAIFLKSLKDASSLAENGIYGPKGTFTGFKPSFIPERRIDFVFVKDLDIRSYRHVDDQMKNGNYVSDHLPVIVDFE